MPAYDYVIELQNCALFRLKSKKGKFVEFFNKNDIRVIECVHAHESRDFEIIFFGFFMCFIDLLYDFVNPSNSSAFNLMAIISK